MGYRDTERELREWYHGQAQRLDEAVTRIETAPRADILDACFAAARGDPSDLIALLRSPRPLDRRDRAILAGLHAGYFDPDPTQEGRPPAEATHRAAWRAMMFVNLWKNANRNRGISNHGLTNLMKDSACNFILAQTQDAGGHPPDRDAVLDLMDRPQRIRHKLQP